MFTDRFIKVPIKVYSEKEKELTGNETCVDTYRKINPMDIIEYGPTDSDDSGQFEYTVVVLRAKENVFTVYLPVNQFEKLLNNYGNQ